MTILRSAIATLAAAALMIPALVGAQAAATDSAGNSPPAAARPASSGLDFSGLVFGDFHVATDSATKAGNGGKYASEFDIGRAYLTFRMPAGDRASVRVTTDVKQQDGSSGAYDGWIVRLKYAYLQYDLIENHGSGSGLSASARVGMLHTVLIDHEQDFWPRYLSKVATERNEFFSSSDLGVATEWTLPHDLGELYGTITNGSGYEHPESDRFKDYALRVSLTPLGQTDGILETLTISPWISVGQTASTFAGDATNPVTDGLERNRYGVFAGIRDPRLTLGGEWAQRTDGIESGATPLERSVANTTGQLYSAFAIVRPLAWGGASDESAVGAIFRWDQFQPDRDVDGKQRFLVAGIFWEPTSQTALALDYQKSEPLDGLGSAASEIWYLHWQVAF